MDILLHFKGHAGSNPEEVAFLCCSFLLRSKNSFLGAYLNGKYFEVERYYTYIFHYGVFQETTNCENGESSCKKTADELNCVPKSDLKCPSDLFVMVEGANDKMCYHMRDIDIGTASFFEAKKYCEETIGDMVRPK